MKRTVLLVAVAAILLGGAGWWRFRRPVAVGGRGPAPQGAPVRRLVPGGTRIRVEVLNTTTTRGVARRVTLYLRDAGFDVVRYGSQGPALDSTLILDRTGHPEWAAMLREALGGAAVASRPDSSRYVDITVLVGRVVRTPPEAFYP